MTTAYPLPRDFKIEFEALTIAATGLNRPECVLALADGTVIAAHGHGGYSTWQEQQAPHHTLPPDGPANDYVPNGIALASDGNILFANLGKTRGGIYRLQADGSLGAKIQELDGMPLPPTNFVLEDTQGTIWFTVSTRQHPRFQAWNHDVADGYIAVHDERGTRIVADGLGYTNEIAFSPDGAWVYVNETYNQRVSRFPLLTGARLGPREIVHEFDGADFPDGLAFDEHGGLWITCVGSNRIVVLRPDDGSLQTILQDTDPDYSRYLGERIIKGQLSAADMNACGTSRLKNVSSLAFGGPGLKRCYIGCLLGDTVYAFDSPLAGAPTFHWHRKLHRP